MTPSPHTKPVRLLLHHPELQIVLRADQYAGSARGAGATGAAATGVMAARSRTMVLNFTMCSPRKSSAG